MTASPDYLLNPTVPTGLRPRPPWAIAEWAFVRRCDGCLACVSSCREGIIDTGADGLPELDFRFAGCDFCGACVAACDRGALRRDPTGRAPAFRVHLTIDASCLALAGEPCRTCAEFCDSYAIRFQGGPDAAPVVVDASCNGCGACIGPCPTRSIHLTPVMPPR